MERKHIGETTPGWRWCMNPECRAGRVHEPKVMEAEPKKAKKRSGFFFGKVEAEAVIDPDICECQECGAKACVPCDRPFHDGETCAAYQSRIKDRIEEEDRALQAIRKITKQCPGCKQSIQKNGGCPGMRCRSRHWCASRGVADRRCRHAMRSCFLLELSRALLRVGRTLQVLPCPMSRVLCPYGREAFGCLMYSSP